jgi:acyl carrier protein
VAKQPFTFDDLKGILIHRVGLRESDIPDDLNASFDDMGLDSLAFIEIQLAVQQQCGFTVPDEDAHQIRTMGMAIDYTNRRLQEQGG